MRIDNEAEQLSIYDLDLWCGRMFQEPSPAEPQKERISGSSSRRSSELKSVVFQSLDLTPGAGNLLGEFYWELISPWRGDALTLNTGVSPREEKESSLSQILQDNPPPKYYLTRKACLGILRRASERGKELPEKLKWALELQSGLGQSDGDVLLWGCGDRGGSVSTGVLTAAFSAGAGSSAGSVGYNENVAPTLKGSASGNCMPSVLCLSDQGGSVMGCSEDVAGTIRAQEHGHQPLVCENHSIESRYTGPRKAAPAMSPQHGIGGANIPLVEQQPVFCITGNAIDRQPQNGGNGIGYQEDVAYTLTATDRHAVFSRQRVDVLKDGEVVSTQNARQHKDATDLVMDTAEQNGQLIRRLTPLECERLQGFPDGWTDIPNASDSARYKALGNSVAIPCVEYVLYGVALVLNDS